MSDTAAKPKATSAKAAENGKPDPKAEAMVYEAQIAVEAAEIRGEATDLTPELFLKLWPLLCRPIPAGFIVTTDAVKGKPYPSTGIKSAQVQIDRMNAVLTPLWWRWETFFSDEGKRCTVEVIVGAPGEALVVRRSPGGVNQASTTGNLYKGSETNAAKKAFAAVGPGHEVYLGATDFDPDTDPDSAKAQATEGKAEAKAEAIGEERAKSLEALVEAAGRSEHLPAKLRGFAVKTTAELTEAQGLKLVEWAGVES